MSSLKFGTATIIKGVDTPEGLKQESYRHPNVWELQETTGPRRVVIAPTERHVELMLKLAEKMSEPFGILYVLLLSRKGEATAGRYQSPELVDRWKMEQFMREFERYFEGDGRHHVWIASPEEGSTLVYDRHNVIYGYGPLEDFIQVAEAVGLKRGRAIVPVPHFHSYNEEMDGEEERILQYWDWGWSELREGDE